MSLGHLCGAIYVVLHMLYHDDYPYLQAIVIRKILFLYCEAWSTQELQIHIIEELGIPPAWLDGALAVYFTYNKNLPKALEHYLRCANWQKAQSIFITSVAHSLFLSVKMASGSSSFDELRNKLKITDTTQKDGTMNVAANTDAPANVAEKLNLTISRTIQELLQCPVCLDAMYPPIHQCLNGHTLCSQCKPRVHNRCPTCRHELGNIRCLSLEQVGASIELPCQYQSSGCVGIFPYYSKINHETQCAFRPYNCPYTRSECTVVGDIHHLVDHLKEDHKVDVHDGNVFYHRYFKSDPHEVENATWMLKVVSCYGQYFCLYYGALHGGTDRSYFACLRFMGNENDAKKYVFSLAVNGYKSKKTRRGAPLSIRRHFHDKYDIMIDKDEASLLFRDGSKELNLGVSGWIWEA